MREIIWDKASKFFDFKGGKEEIDSGQTDKGEKKE